MSERPAPSARPAGEDGDQPTNRPSLAEQVAERVYALLRRDLCVERERRGR
ncbi:MAG: hypothetical protein JXA09_02150 [Anaerolineae bacterium]|nr:hypothetical protein [Anaerolineae bacterium]